MVNTSFTFRLGIQEKGIAIVAFHLFQCMVEWQNPIHLGNSQQGGIVIVSFHLHQCIVEWHESHSIEVMKNMALSYSLPL